MATRQYIGARYVPKFYQNSVDGSTQWESNVVYEPLIYVTLTNGHMYISKKQVPATVGSPASNIDYWLDIGSYNGFIDELQSQIDDLVTDVNGLTAKTSSGKFSGDELIFLADSYGVDSSVGGTSWLTRIKSVYPNCYSNATSGAGFCTLDSGGHDFLSHLTDLSSSITDKAKIKQIIVVGGSNDANRLTAEAITTADIESKIIQFCTYAATNYPNAVVKVLFCGTQTSVDGRYVDGCTRTAREYRSAMSFRPNGVYSDNAENIMKNREFVSDSVHPNYTGSLQIFYAVSSAIYNTKFTFKFRTPVAWQSAGGATDAISVSHFNANSFVLFDGERCQISLRGSDYNGTDFTVNMAAQGQQITWAKGVEKSMAYLTNVPLGPTGANNGDLTDTPIYTIVPCTIINSADQGITNIPIMFTLRGVVLYAKMIDTSHDVNRIRIPNFTIDIPLWTY